MVANVAATEVSCNVHQFEHVHKKQGFMKTVTKYTSNRVLANVYTMWFNDRTDILCVHTHTYVLRMLSVPFPSAGNDDPKENAM